MAFRCIAKPTVAGKASHLSALKHCNINAASVAKLPARRKLHLKQSFVCSGSTGEHENQKGLAEQLTSELAVLDSTLEDLQSQLTERQTGQKAEEILLAQFMEDVKAEQKAWIQESEELDALMAKAAALTSTEEEVAALEKRCQNMQKKINIFSAVLRERERENKTLEEQLEDVEMMGQLKGLKEKASKKSQVVAAGVATADASVSLESQQPILGMGTRLPEFKDGPPLPPDGDSGDSRPMGTVPYIPFRQIVEQNLSAKGMETPGILMFSITMVMSQIMATLWAALKQQLPKEAVLAIEIIAFFGSAMALASLATHT